MKISRKDRKVLLCKDRKEFIIGPLYSLRPDQNRDPLRTLSETFYPKYLNIFTLNQVSNYEKLILT
jgi:hypothetical protein